VFSTYLYEGTGATQTITNGIDLSGEGGLVWIKSRDNTASHFLMDTERGVNKQLVSNATDAENNNTERLQNFNANGFQLGSNAGVNTSSLNYASWTFRKAPKFFDVVTYTGTGSTQNISHSLGAVPAVMMVKSLSSGSRWNVYHKDASPTSNPQNGRMALNTTDLWAEYPGVSVFADLWNQTAPTDSVFTVGSYNDTNASGENFVAYLFAHNDGDGEFGPTGDQDIIKCGSYTGNSSSLPHRITLGFEPQWVLVKKASGSGSNNWTIFDTKRGMYMTDNAEALHPNLITNEDGTNNIIVYPVADGFEFDDASDFSNLNGNTYIYVAIRKGPMATPESASEVFDIQAYSGNSSSGRYFNIGFDGDFSLLRNRTINSSPFEAMALNRQRGRSRLLTTAGVAVYDAALLDFFNKESNKIYVYGNGTRQNDSSYTYWLPTWKRAPGFFDTIVWEGTGSSGTETLKHNLGVTPEMVWIKNTNQSSNQYGSWYVYFNTSDNFVNPASGEYLWLNSPAAVDNSYSPWGSSFTDTTISVKKNPLSNSGDQYIAMLFATLSGISKIGSYTGTGSQQNIDCGFSSGAKLIIVRRVDGGANWMAFDSVRGINTGGDPMVTVNNEYGEDSSTDYVDTYSGGFSVTSNSTINASGGEYIFYAVAA
jgi:hypothetical protein